MDVLKTVDSIILKNSNEKLYQHFKIGNGSYYKYEKGKKQLSEGFLVDRKLKKNINESRILYYFSYPKIGETSVGFGVKLNSNLELIEPLEFDFIPSFLWNNEPSNFISEEKAKEIAIANFTKKGIKIEEPSLKFEKKTKSYVYEIVNKLNETPNIYNEPSGNTEIVKIDAISGKIIEILKAFYGVVIR